MLRLLIQALVDWDFEFHRHAWDTVETQQVWGDSRRYPEHIDYVCRCKECGKIKRFRT